MTEATLDNPAGWSMGEKVRHKMSGVIHTVIHVFKGSYMVSNSDGDVTSVHHQFPDYEKVSKENER
jgi:hypothetical protein